MGSLHLVILLLIVASLALFNSSHILPRSFPVNSHPEEVLAGNLGKRSFNDILQTFSAAEQGREELNAFEIDLASGTYSYTLNLGPSR